MRKEAIGRSSTRKYAGDYFLFSRTRRLAGLCSARSIIGGQFPRVCYCPNPEVVQTEIQVRLRKADILAVADIKSSTPVSSTTNPVFQQR